MRLPVVWLVAALLASACGESGPEAPMPAALESACAGQFCVTYPGDWDVVEEGADFISFSHPAGEGSVLATVGQVSMEGIVAAAGGTWPQLPDEVARSFWSIIDGGDADLATLETLPDGSIRTFGTVASGRLWWRLAPVDFSAAVGLEVRAPNRTWEPHADLLLDGLTVID